MSIEEVIKNLKHMVETCDAGGTVVWYKWIETAREAIPLLKTHPEAQPNEPMTQKDLLGMDGKWVWLTDHIGGKVIGWGRVSETSIQTVDGWLDVEDCGVEFDAYLRPPKEDADE